MTALVVMAACLGLVGYAYAGYPLLAVLLARLAPRPLREDSSWRPRVTACMAVRNEAGRVGAKIEQILGQDYPPELLDLRVLDDGSDDDTWETLQAFAGPRVTLLRSAASRGKAAALGRMAEGAQGEVLLLLDVRQRIEPSALRALLAPLADPRAGAVSGELVFEDEQGSPQGLGLYWRIEAALRRAEALRDSAVGVSGALYVLRRELFVPLPSGLLLDDLALPLAAARQGRRIGFCPAARVYDRVAPPEHEFGRKLRTLGGNVELALRWPWVLVPGINRIWFAYVSHKLARLAVPYAGLGLFVASALLPAPWRWVALAPQVAAPLLALAQARGLPLGPLARPGQILATLYGLNLAALLGPWLYLTGRLSWRPARRPPA